MNNKLLNKLSLVFISVALLWSASQANAAENNAYNKFVMKPVLSPLAQPTLTPAAPNINAKAYVLMDANSGVTLAEKNMHSQMSPASLTKLMTLYLTFEALQIGRIKLDDKVRISRKSWRMGGSKMFLRAGQTVTVDELIKGIIVHSGNDASVAMAEYIAGSEESFVGLMNRQAAALGMTESHFTDATGMPHPNHYSSAHDIALLARSIILKFPQDYKYFSIKKFTFNNITQSNRNRLLWRDPSVDGLKTGHTKAAGYCLVSSALKNDTRLLTVVMGAPSEHARADDSQRLLNYGYRFFESHKLFHAGEAVSKPRVWGGKKKNTILSLTQTLYVTIPKGEYKDLQASVELEHLLKAPIKKGKAYGYIIVKLNDKTLLRQPLVAVNNNPQGGLLARFIDYISFSFHRLFDKKATSLQQAS